jgi:hypothetical protein
MVASKTPMAIMRSASARASKDAGTRSAMMRPDALQSAQTSPAPMIAPGIVAGAADDQHRPNLEA